MKRRDFLKKGSLLPPAMIMLASPSIQAFARSITPGTLEQKPFCITRISGPVPRQAAIRRPAIRVYR